MCGSFDASFGVLVVNNSRLLVAIAIGLTFDAKRSHCASQQLGDKGVIHFHLGEQAQIRDGQQSGAPKQDSALNDISNADAFLFVMVFWSFCHGTTELRFKGN